MQSPRLIPSRITPLLRSGTGRAAVSIILALAFQSIYAGWNWDTQIRTGRGLFRLSPTGRIIRKQSTMAVLMYRMHEGPLRSLPLPISEYILALAYCVVSALPAASVGLVVFILATNRWAAGLAHEPESRCRSCGYILRGLSAPKCPECGEAI